MVIRQERKIYCMQENVGRIAVRIEIRDKGKLKNGEKI